MSAYKFSNTEMKALEYLTRMPGIEENLLAKLLGVSLKEARSIRRRISRILGIIAFPNYRMLGWEMMFIAYSLLPPKRIVGSALEGCTHAYLSSDQFLAVGFARNYTELLGIYEKLCIDLEIPKEHLHLLAFPYELSKILKFFDYTGLIANLTGSALFEYPKPFTYAGEKKLTGVEKKILFEIVREPGIEAKQLSKIVGVEESTVRRVITRLKKSGYLVHVPALNLEATGYSGFAFYHFKVEKEGFEGIREILDTTFFEIVGLNNAFFIMPYREPEEVFETATALTLQMPQQRLAMSLVNYGCIQFDDLNLRKENEYIGVLKRNRNFGDWFEGNLSGREGRKRKTHTRNR